MANQRAQKLEMLELSNEQLEGRVVRLQDATRDAAPPAAAPEEAMLESATRDGAPPAVPPREVATRDGAPRVSRPMRTLSDTPFDVPELNRARERMRELKGETDGAESEDNVKGLMQKVNGPPWAERSF